MTTLASDLKVHHEYCPRCHSRMFFEIQIDGTLPDWVCLSGHRRPVTPLEPLKYITKSNEGHYKERLD